MITQHKQIAYYIGQTPELISSLTNLSEVDKIYHIDVSGNYIGWMSDFISFPFLQGITQIESNTGYIVESIDSAILPYQLFRDATEVVYQDELEVVSGVLRDDINNNSEFTDAVYQSLVRASGGLQSDIAFNSGNINVVSGHLVAVSGFFQSDVDDLNIELEDLDQKYLDASGYLQSQIIFNSGNIDTVSGALTNDLSILNTRHVDLSGVLIDVSGYLNSDMITSSGAVRTDLTSVSGYLFEASGNLSNRISTNSSAIVTSETNIETVSGMADFVSGELITASGALRADVDLKATEIDSVARSGFLQSELITASGSLKNQIDTITIDLSPTEDRIVVASGMADFVSGELITASGALRTDLVAASGFLRSSLTDDIVVVSGMSDFVSGEIITASGALNATALAHSGLFESRVAAVEGSSDILTAIQSIDTILTGDQSLAEFLTTVNNATAVVSGNVNFVSGEIITASGALNSDLIEASGFLRSDLTEDIVVVSGMSDFVSGELATSSGVLLTGVNAAASDIDFVSGELIAASGALREDITAITDLDLTNIGNLAEILGSNADLAALLASLETNIDTVSGISYDSSGILRTHTNNTSGNLNDYKEDKKIFDITLHTDSNNKKHYRFNNVGTTNSDNPTLYLHKGLTYKFNLDTVSDPFYLKTAQGIDTTDAYGDGVTNNGKNVGVVTFEVPHDAPNVLYYNSSITESMTGIIYTTADSVDSIDGGLPDTFPPFGGAVTTTPAATTPAPSYPDTFTIPANEQQIDTRYGILFSSNPSTVLALDLTGISEVDSVAMTNTAPTNLRQQRIFYNSAVVAELSIHVPTWINKTPSKKYELTTLDSVTHEIGFDLGTVNSNGDYEIQLN
tara:strand:+ start:26454 stop:29036 length:2583 start_codon:yes stop_codon:yes gene_type:complete